MMDRQLGLHEPDEELPAEVQEQMDTARQRAAGERSECCAATLDVVPPAMIRCGACGRATGEVLGVWEGPPPADEPDAEHVLAHPREFEIASDIRSIGWRLQGLADDLDEDDPLGRELYKLGCDLEGASEEIDDAGIDHHGARARRRYVAEKLDYATRAATDPWIAEVLDEFRDADPEGVALGYYGGPVQ